MLDRGDEAVLVAPVANFYHELDRMHFDAPRFQAVNSSNSFSAETVETEISDLRAALIKAGKSTNETERIVINHLAQRAKLQKFIDAFEQWTNSSGAGWPRGIEPPDGQVTPPLVSDDQSAQSSAPRPAFPNISAVKGLPDEFADYFEGAIAWQNPAADKDLARQAWERLLERPKEDRHYKSTWAAFMLGRYWETNNPSKAADYFKQVRDLAGQGFADPAGLAAASMGLEARLALRSNDFQPAIELYIEQYAANGWGSAESLQVALGRAVRAGPDALTPLAAKPQTRQLVTAYLISQRKYDDSPSDRVNANVKAWLEAVEQANVRDVESAEQFALAAYQADEMDLAQRWIQRAGRSPAAQWLQAKLLLRAGKVSQATALLSDIVREFPTDPPDDTNAAANLTFSDGLWITEGNEEIFAGRYIRGELGALQLSRRDYIQSLDLLLRADFSADAAYIADHVLTTDELKSYVDENWPAITSSVDDTNKTEAENKLEQMNSDIRYLLARRLARESRGEEARPYYPVAQLSSFDQFMQALGTGWNESLPNDERAKGFAAAAVIARSDGMELFSTESGPDWHMYGGDFESGVTAACRTNSDPRVLMPSTEELGRAAEHIPQPDKRFHYRYQAAALAWEGAKLMPDNSDETASLLCVAGSWLKARDPQTADIFYKALVRRCRKTAIGAKADKIRWFPELDADGNLVQSRLETADLPSAEEVSSPSHLATYPIPGKYFIMMPDDSASDIVAAVQRLGMTMTLRELYAANPQLNPEDYTAGREIFIPSPDTSSAVQDGQNQPLTSEQMVTNDQPDSASQLSEADASQPQSVSEYTIRSGDTLANIARQFGVAISDLEQSNPGLTGNRLRVGQILIIPAPPQ